MDSPSSQPDWPLASDLKIPVEDWNVVFEIQRQFVELQAKYTPGVLNGMLEVVNRSRPGSVRSVPSLASLSTISTPALSTKASPNPWLERFPRHSVASQASCHSCETCWADLEKVDTSSYVPLPQFPVPPCPHSSKQLEMPQDSEDLSIEEQGEIKTIPPPLEISENSPKGVPSRKDSLSYSRSQSRATLNLDERPGSATSYGTVEEGPKELPSEPRHRLPDLFSSKKEMDALLNRNASEDATSQQQEYAHALLDKFYACSDRSRQTAQILRIISHPFNAAMAPYLDPLESPRLRNYTLPTTPPIPEEEEQNITTRPTTPKLLIQSAKNRLRRKKSRTDFSSETFDGSMLFNSVPILLDEPPKGSRKASRGVSSRSRASSTKTDNSQQKEPLRNKEYKKSEAPKNRDAGTRENSRKHKELNKRIKDQKPTKETTKAKSPAQTENARTTEIGRSSTSTDPIRLTRLLDANAVPKTYT